MISKFVRYLKGRQVFSRKHDICMHVAAVEEEVYGTNPYTNPD